MINKYSLTSSAFKKIKLIVSDIDDTLLDNEKTLPLKNIEAIKKACNNSIKVVIASGRPMSIKTHEIYDKLGMNKENEYFIAYNGAAVYEVYSKKLIYSNLLDTNDIKLLEKYFSKSAKNSARYVHLDDNVTVINPNDYSYLEYVYNLKDHIEGNFLNIENLKAYKYQIADHPNVIRNLFESMDRSLMENYNVVITMPCFLEFTKKDVDKYSAITYLAERLNIKNDEIMAIGDSMNDYKMIQKVGIGVAVENAIFEVKEVSKIVTKSNENCGVFEAINLIFLSKKN